MFVDIVIPFNSYPPVFLGITFDEKLNFQTHFENLRIRAIKISNIINIFSRKSCHIDIKTLTNIYRELKINKQNKQTT